MEAVYEAQAAKLDYERMIDNIDNAPEEVKDKYDWLLRQERANYKARLKELTQFINHFKDELDNK